MLLVCVCLLALSWSSKSEAADYVQLYNLGKFQLQNKRYFDAIKTFYRVTTQTARGKRSFGAHYYLAQAYYWFPDIQKAMATLAKAKTLIKRKAHKRAYNKLMSQIKALYSSLKIEPEVDPDEVGKLRIKIKAKSVFSHKHKRRYFRLLQKKLKKQGGILITKPLYLPKGDYDISIARPQCLKLALTQDDKVTRDVSISGASVSVTLKGKASCQCIGGQKLTKDGSKLFCACPAGTGWNKKKKRCEVVKQTPVAAIIGGSVGAAVVVGGVIAAVVILNSGEFNQRPVQTGGAKTMTLWQAK
jgi:hypothetical protein